MLCHRYSFFNLKKQIEENLKSVESTKRLLYLKLESELILAAIFETITLGKLFYLFIFFVTGDKNTKSSSVVYCNLLLISLYMSLFVVTHSELLKTCIFQTNNIFIWGLVYGGFFPPGYFRYVSLKRNTVLNLSEKKNLYPPLSLFLPF